MSNEVLAIIVFIAFFVTVIGGLRYALIDDPPPVKKNKPS